MLFEIMSYIACESKNMYFYYILINIQNLYKVANKRDVVKIQDEFFRIYQENDLEHLLAFCRHLDKIAEGYRAQSVD